MKGPLRGMRAFIGLALRLTFLASLAAADGVLRVELRRFKCDGKLSDGAKCDFVNDHCDIHLKLCIRSSDEKRCIRSVDRDLTHQTNGVNFSDIDFPAFGVPFVGDFRKQEFVLEANFTDTDSTSFFEHSGGRALIDSFSFAFPKQQPAWQTKSGRLLGEVNVNPSRLQLSWRILCTNKHFGVGCEKRCSAGEKRFYFCLEDGRCEEEGAELSWERHQGDCRPACGMDCSEFQAYRTERSNESALRLPEPFGLLLSHWHLSSSNASHHIHRARHTHPNGTQLEEEINDSEVDYEPDRQRHPDFGHDDLSLATHGALYALGLVAVVLVLMAGACAVGLGLAVRRQRAKRHGSFRVQHRLHAALNHGFAPDPALHETLF